MKKLLFILKTLLLLSFCSLFFMSCNKDRKTFTLKTVKVNTYRQANYPVQNIFVKIIESNGSVLGTTGIYPGNYTLPATYAVKPALSMQLYKDQYAVQLWGDSTGLISTSTINMDEYKIIFPLDMETKSADASFSLSGTWK